MIAHLRGSVLEKHPNLVIVESGGVGYEVHIPVSTFTRLPDVGAEAKLRIHMHVREDAMLLYGFKPFTTPPPGLPTSCSLPPASAKPAAR